MGLAGCEGGGRGVPQEHCLLGDAARGRANALGSADELGGSGWRGGQGDLREERKEGDETRRDEKRRDKNIL